MVLPTEKVFLGVTEGQVAEVFGDDCWGEALTSLARHGLPHIVERCHIEWRAAETLLLAERDGICYVILKRSRVLVDPVWAGGPG
jgi:hypothetical protein